MYLNQLSSAITQALLSLTGWHCVLDVRNYIKKREVVKLVELYQSRQAFSCVATCHILGSCLTIEEIGMGLFIVTQGFLTKYNSYLLTSFLFATIE